MKTRKQKQTPEIVIPQGYSIDDILDMDDSDFEEEPILMKEVKIRFE